MRTNGVPPGPFDLAELTERDEEQARALRRSPAELGLSVAGYFAAVERLTSGRDHLRRRRRRVLPGGRPGW